MSNFLLKIRKQPESKKKKLLIFSTGVVMLIIYLVWYFLSGIVIGPVKYVAGDTQELSGVELILGSFENFFSNVNDDVVDIKEGFKN